MFLFLANVGLPQFPLPKSQLECTCRCFRGQVASSSTLSCCLMSLLGTLVNTRSIVLHLSPRLVSSTKVYGFGGVMAVNGVLTVGTLAASYNAV